MVTGGDEEKKDITDVVMDEEVVDDWGFNGEGGATAEEEEDVEVENDG